MILHSTPKESIHLEFWSVSIHNLGHVGTIAGYLELTAYWNSTPNKHEFLKKKSKWFQTSEAMLENMPFVGQ